MKRGVEKGSLRAGAPTAVETVVRTWGDGDRVRVPGWVMTLAKMCDAHGRGKISKRLGYSQAVLSQVINAAYPAALDRIEALVRGAFMAATVDCPVNGETPLDVCLNDQKRTPPFASSWRMQVYRACRAGCPNYRGSK